MPPLPRFRVGVLEDLFQQLRYAPRAAILKDIERAESLALVLEPDVLYPIGFVVQRITGYAPDDPPPDMIPGEALRRDLTVLVERLSDAAVMTEDDAPGALGIEELQQQWNVSRKTVDRLRRTGLPARRVKRPDGKHRLAFMPGAVEAFQQQRDGRLRSASMFSRIDANVEARIMARARRYAALGCSLNQAATKIAHRYGRGLESVRQLIKRHNGAAIFGEPPEVDSAKRELAYRAWKRWLEPGTIGRRLQRPSSAVLRIINDERAAILRNALDGVRLDDEFNAGPTKDPRANLGLGAAAPKTLGEFVSDARDAPPPDRETESVRALAVRSLRVRAATGIADLPSSGASAVAIDRIETDLRWAFRLTAELVRSQAGLIVRSIESRFDSEIDGLTTGEARALIGAGIAAACEAGWTFTPGRGRRLAARTGALVDRALAAVDAPHAKPSEGKAAARSDLRAPLHDWTRSLLPIQASFEPDPRLREGLRLLSAEDRDGAGLLAERFALLVPTIGEDAPGLLGGERPLTLAECAEARGVRVLHLARAERRSARTAIGLVRAAQDEDGDRSSPE